MKRISWTLLVASLALGLSACSSFSTEEDSSPRFSRMDDDIRTYSQPSGTRTPASTNASEYSGYSRNLSNSERENFEIKYELRRLEDQLSSTELQQYNRIKPYLNSDRARLEFLRQGTFEAKERWAMAQGIYLNDATSSVMQAGQSLRVGMNRAQVRDLLGDPDLTEVAGNPRYGNERWRYTSSDTTLSGSHAQTYLIYFESGRVIGWQTVN